MLRKSGKVKELGIYADERGGFYVVDVDTPEEMKLLLAPVADFCMITSHPVVSVDTLQKIFREMAK